MSSFKEFFDPQSLDDRQLGQVEYVLMSPAYADAFEPYLQSIRQTLAQRLLDPSVARKEEHSDDFLRGGIVAIDGLLQFFKQLIATTQMERVDRAMARPSPDQMYDHNRRMGAHVPVLGANEQYEAEPYDAASDY